MIVDAAGCGGSSDAGVFSDGQKSGISVNWGLEAVACELMAISLRYPDADLIRILSSGEWLDAVREISVSFGFDRATALDVDLSDVSLSDLRVEATRMFVGSPKPTCSPYEAYWRAKDDGVAPLMFVNPHTVEVDRFVRACGLIRSGDANEPIDHLAVEFEFLQYLALASAGASIGEGREIDFPGGSPRSAFVAFASEHVLAFAPRFAMRLKGETGHAYYRAIAQILEAYLSHLASFTAAYC